MVNDSDMPSNFLISKDERRRILRQTKDWNKALLPNGKLALEPCFVHQSVPDIIPIFNISENATINDDSEATYSYHQQQRKATHLCMQTKTYWTRNLFYSGIADPSDTQTLKALKFCTTVFKDDGELKRIMSVKRKKDLHRLRYQTKAVIDLTDIARLTSGFENYLKEAMEAWPEEPKTSWNRLVRIWKRYGFLWPEKLYLGTFEPLNQSLDTSMTGNTANSPMSDINPKSQQLPFLEQSRPSEDYVIVCRAKLRPIHEFFPDIYADQKQYIEAIINHFVYNKIDETSNVSSSFSERLQEQADYSEPSNRSRSSLNNDYKAQISTERKKNIGTLSDSATIAAGERRNDNEWKIAINPINPSTSAANRTKDLTSSAFEESQKKKAPNRIPHDQFSNGCCSRTSSSMNTNSGHLTSSSAESSDHTQPTSELPSPHSSKKSRTVYVDTNVIITVQQLFNDQQQMHESGENIRNHNQRQDLEQKCNVEQLVEKELGKPIKESGKLLEIAIASNITADSSINVGCVKIEKQTLGNDKTGVTFSGTVCRTFTKNAALMHDSNDLQSCYAESHYTTASGTITTTGTSVSFEEHSSQGQNPIVLSARQLEKQPLRSFQQSGFTCEDIPEEYNGEHDERYEWSMSSSASSNSSIPEPTPTQSMQMTGTVEKSLPIREESNSSSHIFDKELMNTPTEAELFKREIQKKLKARENAYAAICRSILCLGTPLSNATSSQVRYYDDDDDGDDNYYDGNEKSKEEEETKNAYEQEQQSGRQQQQRSVNKTARTMTPRSRLSNRTASSSANLSPEEYHLRRRTREKEFMKLLQHQESKQQIWTRAMRQSSLRYWLQDIFVINNSPHQQHRYQQQRQKRMATECQNEEAAI